MPSGRNEQGRFAKGNGGGPGNPYARQVAALRRALLHALTQDDIEAIARKLTEQAKAGDVASAKLLFSYVLGKPSAQVDPDTLDAQEWRVFSEQPVQAAELTPIFDGMPAELACRLMRVMLPHISAGQARNISQRMNKTGAPPAAPVQGAPTTNGGNGGQNGGPGIPACPEADRSVCSTRKDRQRKLKKKYYLKAGKVCTRTQ